MAKVLRLHVALELCRDFFEPGRITRLVSVARRFRRTQVSVLFSASSIYLYIATDAQAAWGMSHTICPACSKISIQIGEGFTGASPTGAIFNGYEGMRLVHPKVTGRSVPTEIPENFSADFKEACVVLPDSEKASAALSRRCLQHLLREKVGVKKGDLANEIQQVLDSKTLPSHLSEDLDAIRNIGNFAAHPLKSTSTGQIVDVEPHEAEWLLGVLEQLFDFYFVQPARAQAKRDALNAKLKDLGKPAMKTG